MNSTHHTLIKSCLLVFALLLFSGATHAEGNCPEGYYPIGGESGQGGPQGCAPIPDYNQLPPARWANQWGAIVTDDSKGIVGTATNTPSQDQAKQAAMADCQVKGGTKCKIEIAYGNECAAMIVGDNKHLTAAGPSEEAAIQSGISTCNAGDKNCHVYYSACSLPKRIQ